MREEVHHNQLGISSWQIAGRIIGVNVADARRRPVLPITHGMAPQDGEKMKFCRSSKEDNQLYLVVPTLFWWQTCSIVGIVHFCPAICSGRVARWLHHHLLPAGCCLLYRSRLNMGVSDSVLTVRVDVLRMNGCGPVDSKFRALAKVSSSTRRGDSQSHRGGCKECGI